MTGILRLADSIKAELEQLLPGQRKTQRGKLSLLGWRPTSSQGKPTPAQAQIVVDDVTGRVAWLVGNWRVA